MRSSIRATQSGADRGGTCELLRRFQASRQTLLVGDIRLARTYGEMFPEQPLQLCGSSYLARQLQALERDTELGSGEEARVPETGSNLGSHCGPQEASAENYLPISVPKEGLEPSHPCE
jgi:hypothetical protein